MDTNTNNKTAIDLLTSEDIVTSQQAEVSNLIKDSQSATQRGIASAEATRTAAVAQAEGTFGRQFETATMQAQSAKRAFAQGSSFGTSTAQYKLMNDTITKNLNELTARKNEALANADAVAAQQIAQLEMNELAFKTQANQQYFQNLLGIAGIGFQQKQLDLQQRTQEFTEQQTIGQVALEFGLDVADGETIDSIISRAAPFATEERKMKLAQIQASIDNTRAQTAQIYQARADKNKLNAKIRSMSQEDINTLFQNGTLSPAELSDAGVELSGLAEAQRSLIKNMASTAVNDAAGGGTKQDAFDTLRADPSYMTLNDLELQQIVDKNYVTVPQGRGLSQRIFESDFATSTRELLGVKDRAFDPNVFKSGKAAGSFRELSG